MEKADGRSKAERFACSGTLIDSEWVLTTAKCTVGFGGSIDVGDTVVLGRDDVEAAGTGNVRSVQGWWGSCGTSPAAQIQSVTPAWKCHS